MYETFEHTADLGLRVRAADLDTLFREAALGLFAMIVEDVATIQPTRRVDVTLPADDLDYLLFDWLKKLLFYFDADHLLFARFDVQIGGIGLTATIWGEPLDRSRHELQHEVKAITYHNLKVVQTAEGWEAEVIVDI